MFSISAVEMDEFRELVEEAELVFFFPIKVIENCY